MQWTQVEVFTATAGIEPLTDALSELGVPGFSIRDSADFNAFLQGRQGHWDYVDENLMALADCESSVTFYLSGTPQDRERLEAVRGLLARLKARGKAGEWGRLELVLSTLEEEDWENSWKQYWGPTKVGGKLVVCPTWEEYRAAPGETVIRLDPGMAFGSGTHESTRLCMELLEERVKGGETVLDLGCGSGILAVTALLLGADSAHGVDVEQAAVAVAARNAAQNGVDGRCSFAAGDLASGVERRFDIVLANIVADVVIRLAPDVPRLLADGGTLIASGIIDARETEVRRAFEAAGLVLRERRTAGGWVALAAVCG